MEETNNHNDVTSVDLGSENTLSQGSPQLGRGTHDMQSRGINMQTIEILSSDHSSDDNLLLTSMKYIKKKVAKQNTSKFIPSSSRGRPKPEEDIKSLSRSPESSHSMDYSYEEDISSPGGKSHPIESTFMKLRWPLNVETVLEGGIGKKGEHDNVHGLIESRKRNDRSKHVDDAPLHEGYESKSDDIEGAENGASDGEELPVLPKVPVKRKLMSESKGAEKSSQRPRTKYGNTQTKKQRTPQIDGSVIVQLEFGPRPPNCVSIATLSRSLSSIWLVDML